MGSAGVLADIDFARPQRAASSRRELHRTMERRAVSILAIALAGAADAAAAAAAAHAAAAPDTDAIARANSRRLRDQGPCPDGFYHAFDGYRSCALDANPCAVKKLSGDDLLWTDCGALCGPGCVGLSMHMATECWIYHKNAGEPQYTEASVMCERLTPEEAAKPPPKKELKQPPRTFAPPRVCARAPWAWTRSSPRWSRCSRRGSLVPART